MEHDHAHESNSMALWHAFAMIIASEIGDKTFLIAAILAMRNPRMVVFAGAFSSLVVMSILSAAMGHILPALIPKKWTQFAAAALFLVFGIKMLQEGREMKGGNDKIQEEMREVEEELEEEQAEIEGTGGRGGDGRAIPLEAMEEGGRGSPKPNGNGHAYDLPLKSPKMKQGFTTGARNIFTFFLGPIFVQAFILTFLGEWGDRSQIATIALAAAHSVYIVAIGTIIGHSLCTAMAVIGGRWLSTKISIKHVTLGGSVLFLLFAGIYFYEAWTNAPGPVVDPSHPYIGK